MTTRICQQTKDRSRLTKEEWREYTKTVWAIANKSREDHPAVFPEEIPLRLAKMFSFHGETILDPFAGTGTTARAAIPIGRRVICVDQNPTYVETIQKECGGLLNGHDIGCEALEAVHGDSRDLGFIETGTVALIVTSPPYWDKANYGRTDNDLGGIETYADFIQGIRPHSSKTGHEDV